MKHPGPSGSRASAACPSGFSDGRIPVWGVHPVRELLKLRPGQCSGIFILPSFGRKRQQAALVSLAERNSVTVYRTDSFNSIVPPGTVHQGVVAMTAPFWETGFDEIPTLFKGSPPLVLVCDGISDPHNLGAVMRNCVAFGAGCVMFQERNSSPVTGTVAKASAGALFHLGVCRVKNLAGSMGRLRKKGIWIAGLSADGEKRLDEFDMTVPLALVAGSEHSGLRPVVRRECDIMLKIPMTGRLDSLNVASASAVALYEASRQRSTL